MGMCNYIYIYIYIFACVNTCIFRCFLFIYIYIYKIKKASIYILSVWGQLLDPNNHGVWSLAPLYVYLVPSTCFIFFWFYKTYCLPFQSCFREMAQDHLVPALTNWIIIKLPCFFLSFLMDWIILIQEKDSHHIGLLGIFFQNNTNFYTISLVSSFSELFRKLISWV